MSGERYRLTWASSLYIDVKVISPIHNNWITSLVFFQEFECGVQFESTEKNKQEWSFTLYDFDGQGKVTKEVRSGFTFQLDFVRNTLIVQCTVRVAWSWTRAAKLLEGNQGAISIIEFWQIQWTVIYWNCWFFLWFWGLIGR